MFWCYVSKELGLVNMLKVSFGLKWKLLPLKYLFSVYIFQVLSEIDVSQIYIWQELIVTVETKLIFQVCVPLVVYNLS